jgi:acyl carrier protein
VTEDEVLAGIEEVARAQVGWEGRIDGRMRLIEDLGLDSLKALTLAVEVENRFEVCLDPERDAELVTVADLVAAVRKADAARS